jgi:hypothetical protein
MMKPRGLGFERLEGRLLLAGDVNVTLSRGNLSITGDAQDNKIEIAYVGHQKYRITGIIGTDTTVRGGTHIDVTGVTGSVSVNMRDGNNRVEINPAAGEAEFVVPKDLTIRSGRGNDVILVKQANVRGTLSINTGAASEGDEVAVVDTHVVGSGSITTGNGADRVGIRGLSAPALRRGQFSVSTGEGNDQVGVVNSTLARNLSISTGNGNDLIGLVDVQSTAAISVSSGHGAEDRIGVAGVTSGHMTLNGGNSGRGAPLGISEIGVTGSTINGSLTIRTGIGGDSVAVGNHEQLGDRIQEWLEGVDYEVPTGSVRVTNTLSITTDNGDDRVWLQDVVQAARLSIDTGNGNDQIGIVDSTLQGDISILTGSDNDQVGLLNVKALGRSITIKTGNGNNGVDLVGLAEVEARNINVDGGNSGTRGPFGASYVGVTNSTLTGNLTIKQGHGPDWVAVGDHDVMKEHLEQLQDPFGNPIEVTLGSVVVGGTVGITTNSPKLVSRADTVLINHLRANVLRLDTGRGADELTIGEGVDVVQEFTVNMGDDNDTLELTVLNPVGFVNSLPTKATIDGGRGRNTLKKNEPSAPLDAVFKNWQRIQLL